MAPARVSPHTGTFLCSLAETRYRQSAAQCCDAFTRVRGHSFVQRRVDEKPVAQDA